MSDLFWRWLRDVRPTERGRVLFFLSVSTLLTVGQTLGLASSEALFLARYGVENLPQTFIVASVVTVLGMLGYGACVGSIRNDRIFVHMLWISALVLAGAIFAIRAGVAVALPGLICVYFLMQAVFYNHFWTFASDYFDILASKRLVPVFAVGASVGGLAGGVLAVAIGRTTPPETLIAAWAVFLVATAVVIRGTRRALQRWGTLHLEELDETSLEGLRAAARYLGRSPLGLWLALSAGAMSLALFVGQYLYSEIFVRSYPTAESLAVFFGLFLALSNLGEIVVEVGLTTRLVRRLGVTSANLVHPVLTLLCFVALAVKPVLVVAPSTTRNGRAPTATSSPRHCLPALASRCRSGTTTPQTVPKSAASTLTRRHVLVSVPPTR